MYESDEWYIQDDLTTNPAKKKVKPFSSYADYSYSPESRVLDDEWDLDASASDNESFDIEEDRT